MESQNEEFRLLIVDLRFKAGFCLLPSSMVFNLQAEIDGGPALTPS